MKHKTQIHVKQKYMTKLSKKTKKHKCKALVITKRMQTKTATCHICNKNIYCKNITNIYFLTFICISFNIFSTNINMCESRTLLSSIYLTFSSTC